MVRDRLSSLLVVACGLDVATVAVETPLSIMDAGRFTPFNIDAQLVAVGAEDVFTPII